MSTLAVLVFAGGLCFGAWATQWYSTHRLLARKGSRKPKAVRIAFRSSADRKPLMKIVQMPSKARSPGSDTNPDTVVTDPQVVSDVI